MRKWNSSQILYLFQLSPDAKISSNAFLHFSRMVRSLVLKTPRQAEVCNWDSLCSFLALACRSQAVRIRRRRKRVGWCHSDRDDLKHFNPLTRCSGSPSGERNKKMFISDYAFQMTCPGAAADCWLVDDVAMTDFIHLTGDLEML